MNHLLRITSALGFLFLLACPASELGLKDHQDEIASKNGLTWQKISSATPAAPFIAKYGDEVELRLTGYFLGKKNINGKDYSYLVLPGHKSLAKAGYPELPKVRTNIIIPTQATMNPILIEEQHLDLTLPPPLPSRGDIPRNINPATVPYTPNPFYTNGKQYPAAPFFADNTFKLRDHRGLPLQFQPFIYMRAQNTIRIYTYLRVRLNLQATVPFAGAVKQSPDFLSIYANSFLNHAEVTPRYTPLNEPGRMIIITPDVFYPAVLPLAEWKNQRGLPTEIKKFSEIGADAYDIKMFIKQEFAQPKSITYVVLVGDADTLPSLKGRNPQKPDCDACYAMVAGNDIYPDLFISRISVRTVEEAEAQVAKFIRYEREPSSGEAAAWYRRAINVASDENGWGNLFDWERAEALRQVLENYGFTSVAKIYDPSATKEELIDRLNEGASLVNYLGHGDGTTWKTTDFNIQDAVALHNGTMLPMVIDVSCLNGSFVQEETCLAESFLRAGTKAEPAGAVAMYSASTPTSWDPPTIMQDWLIKELYTKELSYSIGSLYFGGGMDAIDQCEHEEGQKLIEQYNIFGDASLLVRSKPPMAISVEHPSEIPGSGSVNIAVKDLAGAPVSGASVTLYNGELVALAYTNSAGQATLKYNNTGLGTIRLTVYGFNLMTYGVDLPIVGGSNRPPEARISAKQSVKSGSAVILDGELSHDPDGNILSYAWTQTKGPAVMLNNLTGAKLKFNAPVVEQDTELQFKLVVSDGEWKSNPAFAQLIVKAQGSGDEVKKEMSDDPLDIPDHDPDGVASIIPITKSGKLVKAQVAITISHPHPSDITLKLECPSGTVVTLQESMASNGNAADIHQTYDVTACKNQSIKGNWYLHVSDNQTNAQGILEHWALVVEAIDVGVNQPPVANAGSDLTGPSGDMITLNGKASYDPDGDPLIYHWVQESGPKAFMVGSHSVKPSFQAPMVSVDTPLVFKLVVNDWEVDSPADTVTVMVTKPDDIDWIEANAYDWYQLIPDGDAEGFTSRIQLDEPGVVATVKAEIDIEHPAIAELTVEFICPNGHVIMLHNHEGGNESDLFKSYTVDQCNGQPIKGTWSIRIIDSVPGGEGALIDWNIKVKKETR